MSDLSGKTTIVVGASRGLGRAIAAAFAEAGADVIAISRSKAAFPEPAQGAGTTGRCKSDSKAAMPACLVGEPPGNLETPLWQPTAFSIRSPLSVTRVLGA